MIFEELDEFRKELKKLVKKYRTLENDLETIKKVLKAEPKERPPFSFKIDGLGIETNVIKIKKIACKSLKGKGIKTGLRLIYAYFEEDQKIVFVEIYHKNTKNTENKTRILKLFR
jgi:mRNA-degrading endonuclease YafQ of YafQ-DinJ toxin-antitoxin module